MTVPIVYIGSDWEGTLALGGYADSPLRGMEKIASGSVAATGLTVSNAEPSAEARRVDSLEIPAGQALVFRIVPISAGTYRIVASVTTDSEPPNTIVQPVDLQVDDPTG